MTMTPVEMKSVLEAIIYAADEPATLDQLAGAIGEEKNAVRAALDELVASHASDERGIEIRAVAGGYRYYTKPQHHDAVRRFIKSLRPPVRLTMPALETLAVIAYKQPVTQPEIQEIRGVSCAGVIETLLEKRLITTAGRKQVIGRPILYRTAKEFLVRFGLSAVDELPSLKEFEALAREALVADDGVADDGVADPAPGEVNTQESPISEAANTETATGDVIGTEEIRPETVVSEETVSEELAEEYLAPEAEFEDSASEITAEIMVDVRADDTAEGSPQGQSEVDELIAAAPAVLAAELPEAEPSAADESRSESVSEPDEPPAASASAASGGGEV